MKKLIVGICLLGWMASCGGGKKHTDVQEVAMESIDSVEVVADTLDVEEVEEEQEVSTYAERVFADFCITLLRAKSSSFVASFSLYLIIWIIVRIPS